METPPTSPHNRDTFNKILAQLDDPNEAIQHNALHRCNKWLRNNNLRWTDIIYHEIPKNQPPPIYTYNYRYPPSSNKEEDAWFVIAAICMIGCMLTIIYRFHLFP